MSRAPRRQFLAPFILTAAAALPGCKHKTDTTGPKDPVVETYQSWSVWATPEGCEAANNADNDCPEGASCNPPPPMAVACPDGMTGDQLTILQAAEGGPCTLENGDEIACPEELAPPEDPEDPEDEEFPED